MSVPTKRDLIPSRSPYCDFLPFMVRLSKIRTFLPSISTKPIVLRVMRDVTVKVTTLGKVTQGLLLSPHHHTANMDIKTTLDLVPIHALVPLVPSYENGQKRVMSKQQRKEVYCHRIAAMASVARQEPLTLPTYIPAN